MLEGQEFVSLPWDLQTQGVLKTTDDRKPGKKYADTQRCLNQTECSKPCERKASLGGTVVISLLGMEADILEPYCEPERHKTAWHKTAWLAVDWVNWSAHGKSKWAGLTYIG